MSVDYMGTSVTDDGFDFSRLLNDDFFQPVRILFQARHFVSASKLLMVAIDSISYIEFGSSDATFVNQRPAYPGAGSAADLGRLSLGDHTR